MDELSFWHRAGGVRGDGAGVAKFPVGIGIGVGPGVRKAVKWNSPLYGAGDADRGWFRGLHCCAKYVKVAFFKGASLVPPPPGASKQTLVRYLDLREGEPLDEARFAAWVRRASELPGERM